MAERRSSEGRLELCGSKPSLPSSLSLRLRRWMGTKFPKCYSAGTGTDSTPLTPVFQGMASDITKVHTV